MQIYPFTSVNMDAIRLFSLETSKDLIYIRNNDDDGFYFEGPKCHLGKESVVLNDTTNFRIPIIFNSDNVSFIHMLNRLKKRIIEILVEKKHDFFNEEDLNEIADVKQLIDDIFLEPYTVNTSKGTVKLNVVCNPRNNTRWANDYKLRATSKDGATIPLDNITSNTPFIPVINVRGVRTKDNFTIEFVMQQMILIEESKKSPTINNKVNDDIRKECDEEEVKELNEINVDCDEGNVFKVKKPRNMYMRFVSQFQTSLFDTKRKYLEEWMKEQNIRNPDALLECIEDEEGYESQ